jgi:hypothetical protein
MVGIVQANGNELGHMRHWATHAGLAAHQGQFVGFEFGQFGQDLGRELGGANVGQHSAEVAQSTCGVDQAWFFFAGLAVTNEFHRDFLGVNSKSILRDFALRCTHKVHQ